MFLKRIGMLSLSTVSLSPTTLFPSAPRANAFVPLFYIGLFVYFVLLTFIKCYLKSWRIIFECVLRRNVDLIILYGIFFITRRSLVCSATRVHLVHTICLLKVLNSLINLVFSYLYGFKCL